MNAILERKNNQKIKEEYTKLLKKAEKEDSVIENIAIITAVIIAVVRKVNEILEQEQKANPNTATKNDTDAEVVAFSNI